MPDSRRPRPGHPHCPGYRACRMEQMLACLAVAPRRAETCLEAAAAEAVRAVHPPPDLAAGRDELVQDVLVAVASNRDRKALRRADRATLLLSWLIGVARNCVHRSRDRRSRAHSLPISSRPVETLTDEDLARRGHSPPERAMLHEELDRALAFADQLPPPCNEIAYELLAERTHREITEFLRTWRPEIGPDHCRRLIRLTKKMLRALEAGEDPRPLWRGGWDSKRNPWFPRPPPPPKFGLVG